MIDRNHAVEAVAPRRSLFADLRARAAGLLCLLAGAFLAKAEIYDPLHASDLGMQTVRIHYLLVIGAVALPAMGICYVIFGENVDRFFSGFLMDRQHISRRDVLIVLLVVIPVAIVWVWIMTSLYDQGYTFS